MAIVFAATAHAQQPVTLYLNWIPGPEHAPIYFAKKAGLYSQAGVEVTIEPGTGSANTLRLLSEKPSAMGVADFLSVLTARGKEANVVAVMSMFENSPYTFLWLKSSGIRSMRDLPGRKIGAPERDPARKLWPALAQANGIDPQSVIWVDVANNAKVAALKSKTIDVTINAFLDSYSTYPGEFGDELVQLPWREARFNPYSNSLVAPATLLQTNPAAVSAVVKATQRAEAACLANPEPCIDALVEAFPKLQREKELANWNAGRELFFDRNAMGFPLGAFDPARVRSDYEIARKAFGIDNAYDPLTAFSNEFLDASVAAPR